MTKLRLSQFKPINYKAVINIYVTVYKQDSSGNTYHRVEIWSNEGNKILDSGKKYGYGSAYEQTAQTAIASLFSLPAKYKDNHYSGGYNWRELQSDKVLKLAFHVTYSQYTNK